MSYMKSWRYIFTRYKTKQYCKSLKNYNKINNYKEGTSLVLKKYPRCYKLDRWLNSSIKISQNLLIVLWK